MNTHVIGIGRFVVSGAIVAACGGAATERSSVSDSTLDHRGQTHEFSEESPDFDPASLVSFELVSETTGFPAGWTGQLAAILTIVPGWHIYWKNPGDSGLPTSFRVKEAPGLHIDPILYPGPVRFESEGEITNYGYAGEVVFPVRVRADDDFVGGSVTVEARWLACRKDACVPGKASHTLNLGSVLKKTTAASKIHRAVEALPGDEFPPQLGVRVSVLPNKDSLTVDIQAESARQVEVFPVAPEAVADLEQSPDASSTRFRLIPKTDLTDLAIVAAHSPEGQVYYVRLTADEHQKNKEQ